MTTKNVKPIPNLQPGSLLGVIPLGLAVILVPQRLNAFLYDPAFLFIITISLLLYMLAAVLAGPLQRGLWAGYLNLATSVTWLALGLEAALVVVVAGTLLAALIRSGLKKSEPQLFDINEVLGRMAINGLGALLGFTIYHLLGGQLPFMDFDITQLLPLAVALFACYLSAQALGALLTSRPMFNGGGNTAGSILSEVLLVTVAATLPPIFYSLGPLPFTILMGLAAAQAIRYSQVSHTEETLVQRVRELSILTRVGQTISSRLAMDDVLLSIYQEVNQLINTTSFFIALYDAERDIVDYRFVMEEGQRQQWPSRQLSSGMTDYVIRHSRSLLIRRDELERMRTLGIDPESVHSAAFVGVPLMIGDKLLGIMGGLNKNDGAAFGNAEIKVLQTIASQASLSIRNASLYERMRELANNLSAINRSVQEVMFTLESGEAMEAACRTAMQITQAQKAAIYLVDVQNRDTSRLAQASGLPEDFAAQTAALRGPINAHTTRLASIPDVQKDPDPRVRKMAEIGGYRALVRVPLRSGNTIIGCMEIYHDTPRLYDEAELDLLETLANQLTAALDNAELLRALELYASEQAQLVHLSRISTSSLELERVVSSVSIVLQQMIDVDYVSIGLFVPGRSRIRLYGHNGLANGETREIALEEWPEIRALTGEAGFNTRIYLRSEETLSESVLRLMARHELQTLMLVPMMTNNDLLGVIILGDERERVFNDNDRRLIEVATNQVAAQIHNAQIYTLTEEALIQRLQQLSLIEDIAQQISSLLDLEQLIGSVLEAVVRATQADIAALALVGDHYRVQIIMQEQIEGQWQRSQFARSQGEGLIGQVIKSGGVLLVPDTAHFPGYLPLSEAAYGSAIAVPLVKDAQVLGVLVVESRQRDFFSDEQVGFVKSLAGHATISINNARLLEERQSQIETLTSLRQLSLQVLASDSRSQVAEAILQTTLDMLGGSAAALYYQQDNNFTIYNSLAQPAAPADLQSYLQLPADLLHQVLRSGEVHVVERVQEHTLFADMEELPYTSLLLIPTKGGSGNEIIGVMFEQERHFTERDHNIVDLLSIQAAGYLHNALLTEQIRSSNDRMRAILDSTRDGIILLDRSGNLIDANLSAGRMLGIDLNEHADEYFPKTLIAHTDSDEENLLIDTARILHTSPQRITNREYVLSHSKRNQRFFIKEVGSPVRDHTGSIVGRLLSLHDITEERALADYREKIRRMVFHDLRSPLSVIISSLTLANELVMELQGESRHYLVQTLEASLESGNNLLQLVNTLLDIPKLQEGRMQLNREPVSLPDLAQRAYSALHISIREAEINFEIEVLHETPPVEVDPDLLRRVLINLIDNATRYTPRGGRILVRIENDDQQAGVCVFIADSGPGIPPEKRESVFQEFEQIEGSKPERGNKGSGLGLTFCKLAVEAHGGQIWVEPDGPLSGACIAFSLPLVPPAR